MGGKKKIGKGKCPTKKPKSKVEKYLADLQYLTPADRIAEVRSFWESTTPDERLDLLKVSISDLRAYTASKVLLIEKEREASIADSISQNVPPPIFLDPNWSDVLESGLKRSQARDTWKQWKWPPGSKAFYDTEAFKKYLQSTILPAELAALLPQEPDANSKCPEKPAEAAFRKRMSDLLTKIQEAQRAAQEESQAALRRIPRKGEVVTQTRDPSVDMIIAIFEVMQNEHAAIYQSVLLPVTEFVCELLPEGSRVTTGSELHFEDLDNLPSDDCVRISEWLTEKVDAYASKLRADEAEIKQAEEEGLDEEPIAEVDLFSLLGPDGKERAATAAVVHGHGNGGENDADNDDTADLGEELVDDDTLPPVDDIKILTVNSKWLWHLQTRLLGEDGQPKKCKPEEDPQQFGLVLEWVYGTIVATAEKARDCAHRSLGMSLPNAEAAVAFLKGCLEDQAVLEGQAREARELMDDMVNSRKVGSELALKYGQSTLIPKQVVAVKVVGGSNDGKGDIQEKHAVATAAPLPDEIVLAALEREKVLTKAKLFSMKMEHQAQQRRLRSVHSQIRQLEPEHERLKAELEVLKSGGRGNGDEVSFRTGAEAERHRTLAAEASIEQQMEVQAAMRKARDQLARFIPEREELERQMICRDKEIGHHSNWGDIQAKAIKDWKAAMAAVADGDATAVIDAVAALEEGRGSDVVNAQTLDKLRSHFESATRAQLYDDEDDKKISNKINTQLGELEAALEEGRVALLHIESFAINVACDDPGIIIGSSLVLPFLQERMDRKALEYKDKEAAKAEVLVMQMELETAEKERAEKEKKLKAKAKAKEKERSQKEKERAQVLAKQKAEEDAKAAEEAKKKAEVEEARQRRAAEAEAARREEEEMMEKRRLELLADENSYWRQRLEQDELAIAQMKMEAELVKDETLSAATSSSSTNEGQRQGKKKNNSNRGKKDTVDSAEEDGFISTSRQVRRNNNNNKKAEEGQRKEKESRKEQNKKQKQQQMSGQHIGNAPPAPTTAAFMLDMPCSNIVSTTTAAAPVTRAPSPPTPEVSSRQCSATQEPPPSVGPSYDSNGNSAPQLSSSSQRDVNSDAGSDTSTTLQPQQEQEHKEQQKHVDAMHASQLQQQQQQPPHTLPLPQGVMMMPPYMAPQRMYFPPHPTMHHHPYHQMPHYPHHMMPPPPSQSMQHYGHAMASAPPPPPPGRPNRASDSGKGNGGAVPATKLRVTAQEFVPSGMLLNVATAPTTNNIKSASDGVSNENESLESVASSGTEDQGGAFKLKRDSPRGKVYDNAAAASRPSPEELTKQQQDKTEEEAALLEKLKLIKGLTNAPGAYNCFLNVIVQSLWHLTSFRGALLRVSPQELTRKGAKPADVSLLIALQSLFKALSATEHPSSISSSADDKVVSISPRELRHALSGLRSTTNTTTTTNTTATTMTTYASPAAISSSHSSMASIPPPPESSSMSAPSSARFDVSEMHDASEVLVEIFDALHRADVGDHDNNDPTLPRSVQIPSTWVNTTPSSQQQEKEDSSSDNSNAVWGDGAGLQKVKQAPPSFTRRGDKVIGLSFVQRIFGLEMLVPTASSRSSSSSSSGGNAEALHFWKYIHLIPSTVLRATISSSNSKDDSFEAKLIAAETSNGTTPLPLLESRPTVLSLGIVWEGERLPEGAIATAMKAVDTTIDISKVFGGGDTADHRYQLKCVVSYVQSHYKAFILNEEVGKWLLFDDSEVSLVGTWGDVLRLVEKHRLQPSVLLYEHQ